MHVAVKYVKKIKLEVFLKYILFLKTRAEVVRCENGKRNYVPYARLSEDYKTGMPAQATVRDVAAILFAKQFACEAIEICIINIVRFRSFEIMLIT